MASPLVAAPALRLPVARELDEPTQVNDIPPADLTKIISPLPPPAAVAPPVVIASSRPRPSAEPTQIVIPLPPPEAPKRSRRGSPEPTQIVAPLPSPFEPPRHARKASPAMIAVARADSKVRTFFADRRRRFAAAALGGAMGVAAILLVAIGFSTPGPAAATLSNSARPAMESEPPRRLRAVATDEPLEPPRRPMSLDTPAPPKVREVAADADPLPETPAPGYAPPIERAPLTRRSRSRSPAAQSAPAPASSPAVTRRPASVAKPAAKPARSRPLTYDPDALFLKRP